MMKMKKHTVNFFETDDGLSSNIKDNLNYKNKSEYIKYCIGFMRKFISEHYIIHPKDPVQFQVI